MKNIHIIGGGNLGVALAIGITKFVKDTNITVTRRNTQSIEYLTISNKNIRVSNNNTLDINKADIIILTVKPYQVAAVLTEIAPYIGTNKIIASAVSGVTIDDLSLITHNKHAIIRIMPNIAAQFGASATCISYSTTTTQGQAVVNLFAALGTAVVIDEKMMDGATVLGACGTAYALRYIRAAMQAGIEIGFDATTALAIASQTVKGAAQMTLEEMMHPEQLIDRVTTPQGCTIVGLNEMEHQGFSSSLIKGIKTSYNKIKGI
jgi:pyrroline-5-carboxylate reductase